MQNRKGFCMRLGKCGSLKRILNGVQLRQCFITTEGTNATETQTVLTRQNIRELQ
jgi:hypothetical protein